MITSGLLCFLINALTAGQLPIGSSIPKIYKQLGAPDSTIELPTKTVLLYETAELTLKDGRLLKAKLRTPEEVTMEALQTAKAQAEWEAYQQKEAENRLARGLAILERKEMDAAFRLRPGRAQVRYWQSFMRDYPGIDVSADLDAAIQLARTEAKEADDRAARYAAAQPKRQLQTRTAPVDSGSFGGWAYNCSPNVVVVNGGGVAGYPVRTGYPRGYTRPILSVGYQSDNFSVRYQSGGGYYNRPVIGCSPQRPVVVITPATH